MKTLLYCGLAVALWPFCLRCLDILGQVPVEHLLVSAHYLGVAAIICILLSVLCRLLAGASVKYLLETKFYEIPCLRVVFHVFRWYFFVCTLGTFLLPGGILLQTHNKGAINDETNIIVGILLVVAIVLTIIYNCLLKPMIKLPDVIPPCNNHIKTISRSEHVSRAKLSLLGSESFPEMLVYGYCWGHRLRKLFVFLNILSLIILGLLILGEKCNWEGIEEVKEIAIFTISTFCEQMMNIMSRCPVFPPEITIPGFVICTLLLVYFLNTDYSYLIFRFPTFLLMTLTLALGIFYCFCMLDPEGIERLWCLLGLNSLFFARCCEDLYNAHKFLKKHNVIKPLEKCFGNIFPQIREIKKRPDCELPRLTMDEIGFRIENGLHNVEKYSKAALRNMARFIGVCHVEAERFACIRFRILTVRRYTVKRCLGGTSAPCCWPHIPIWDETLFPLLPPYGYEDSVNCNWLESLWDGVKFCGTCGGSGRVPRTETYKDHNGETRTRTVYVTCSCCGGSGRLRYQQGLVTQWQKQTVLSTEPTAPIVKYMEDAEDETYYTQRLFEERQPLVEKAETNGKIGVDLVESLDHSVEEFKSCKLNYFVTTIEKLHDGKIYRSEIQVIGFWTLRIIFRRMFGRYGWFFGRNSEFYFRSIPLGLQMIPTVGLILPVSIIAIGGGILYLIYLAFLFVCPFCC